ncbi:hypothetical protein PVAP13_9KG164600 [Panicum virgatum]|uniref:Cysteine proteinase inhibitor n=1 Tax=Panicum virgatum TaxID=38727 RepID=A0A8T0NLW5_PANVG|nr:hypothetical protein PVAP13_9KG164600 [Panicum virgatum]
MKQSAVGVAAVLVVALLAAGAATVAVVAAPQPPAGYTTQEDASSDFIKQVGKFAVNVYKIAYMIPMTYVSTSQCWSAPAGGGANYYWMVLWATNRTGAAGQYVSTVWGIPGSESKTWKLLSFNSTTN